MDLVIRENFIFDLNVKVKTLIIVDSKILPHYDNIYKINHINDNKFEKLNIITSELASLLLIENDSFFNNFNLVIINIIKNKDLYTDIILKIYSLKYSTDRALPKLEIYNYTKNVRNLYMEIKNIKVENNYKKIDTKFLEKDKNLNSLIKFEKYKGDFILILTDNKEDYYKLFRDKKYRIINFKRNEDLGSREEKINIIIIERIIPLPYENIKLVINDCFSSSENLELLKNYIQKEGEIYTLKNIEEFKKLPIFNYPYFDKESLYKYYIKILNNQAYEPLSVLDRYPVEETVETLSKLHIIDKNKVLIDSDLLFKIGLTFKASLVLYRLIKKYNELPLFPFIVLSVLIDKKLPYLTILNFLKLWEIFSSEFLSLEVEKIKIENFLEKQDFDSKLFLEILETIKDVYKRLYLDLEIKLGLYETSNLLKISKDVLIEVYRDDIYYLYDRNDYLYTNNQKILSLDYESKEDYPETVVSFKIDKNKIYSFLTL